ncbi:sigma-54 dependent transcriptional regulator [Halodesulfovibrio sp.]|jgi:DNA-binding NtrC family response regulator|uniref:sigma-54-dependent transcriptional regulator n=1 Tax=Halodesulfovibrio sp. TaxID=1912772 RepID=UPI0025D6C296|nr:sigma-54 dependent transcriptional regulator [Halodesulfovibrio sp.]MCT4535274.1 sigma-54 dependent transcriptional regulator [Halodesulfovibrio sp.]
MRRNILVVDKDNGSLAALPKLLRSAGYEVIHVHNHNETRSALAREPFSVVIAGLEEHHAQKQNLLKTIKADTPDTEVILVSRAARVDAAVRAMQMGAFHFLSLPENPADLLVIIEKAMEKNQLQSEVNELRQILQKQQAMPTLIGKSAAMQELKKEIARIAPLDCTVLIQGETGTGKEMVAKMLHKLSARANNRFYATNAGVFSAELLANELFGHEKGAFTGAQSTKEGIFEAASKGTLLLDEIGEMPINMQVQLLRVLQERTITRVGGTSDISIDVRVIAATHRNLEKLVEDNQFRQDLFYRLNVFTLRIPALRKRPDDIPLFCNFFMQKYSKNFNKEVTSLSENAMLALMRHSYPGNVRELENIIERAVVLCDGETIHLKHLPQEFSKGSEKSRHVPTNNIHRTLADVEQEHITQVLESVDGSKAAAAKILGIDRATLWRKLKKFAHNI